MSARVHATIPAVPGAARPVICSMSLCQAEWMQIERTVAEGAQAVVARRAALPVWLAGWLAGWLACWRFCCVQKRSQGLTRVAAAGTVKP
jgi:hypothetical protein